MKKIALTNDDGHSSKGLTVLAEELAKRYSVIVVVPDTQRSATGKALTLNRPLRIYDRGKIDGYRLITHDGTPADSVILAKELDGDIDFFVSGINMGANLGYQSMATSGTVGAIVEAAIMGIPGVAVSRVVNTKQWFHHSDSNRSYDKEVAITIGLIERVLERGLPTGVDALNLNFPCDITENSRIVVTRPAMTRMSNSLERRVDPNGSSYYWITGQENAPEPNTDAYEVLKNGNISLSPIVIDYVNADVLGSLSEFLK